MQFIHAYWQYFPLGMHIAVFCFQSLWFCGDGHAQSGVLGSLCGCLPSMCSEIIMNVNSYIHEILAIWISGVLSGVMHTSAIFPNPFYGANIIYHLFCYVLQLLKFTCSDEYVSELEVTGFLSLVTFLCFVPVGFSPPHTYVLRIPSAEGTAMAFSICPPT